MKSERELSAMDNPELVEYIASMSAQVDKDKEEAKTAMEKEHEDAKKAMEDKEHEAKKAMEDEEKKHDAVKQAVLKAMENDDKEEAMKAVLKAMGDDDNKEHEAKKAMEDDDEKKALKAQVTYLADTIKTPKIQYLTKVYQAALTPKETITEYVAEWNKQTPQQLDAEIKKLGPLINTITQTQLNAEVPEMVIPTMSTLPTSDSTYKGSVDVSKISKMSDAELFGGHN